MQRILVSQHEKNKQLASKMGESMTRCLTWRKRAIYTYRKWRSTSQASEGRQAEPRRDDTYVRLVTQQTWGSLTILGTSGKDLSPTQPVSTLENITTLQSS